MHAVGGGVCENCPKHAIDALWLWHSTKKHSIAAVYLLAPEASQKGQSAAPEIPSPEDMLRVLIASLHFRFRRKKYGEPGGDDPNWKPHSPRHIKRTRNDVIDIDVKT